MKEVHIGHKQAIYYALIVATELARTQEPVLIRAKGEKTDRALKTAFICVSQDWAKCPEINLEQTRKETYKLPDLTIKLHPPEEANK